PTPTPPPPPQPPVLAPTDLSRSLLALLGLGVLAFVLMTPARTSLETRLWPVLLMMAAGLTGYVLYGILAVQLAEMDGIGPLVRQNADSHLLTPLVTVFCGLLGLGGLALARFIRQRYTPNEKEEEGES
ncbi:MAG: hypothetical protein D6796_15645, partial [Caldilineae bacterium]